jgi:outer membrane protein assembly factor BamD (BamD/ComL family)
MSVSGISGSSLFAGYNSTSVQNKFQHIQQGFQQLGQDLQSGNLSQAQTDFSALQQLLPNQSQGATSSTQSELQASNPVSQAISQLGQDLKAGNLSAAQSDFTTLQQDLQQQGAVSGHRHHHHHAEGSQASGQQSGPATLFGDLGQELQSGNLSAAQQTYSALQQDFLQFTGASVSSAPAGSGTSTSGSTSLNVSA